MSALVEILSIHFSQMALNIFSICSSQGSTQKLLQRILETVDRSPAISQLVSLWAAAGARVKARAGCAQGGSKEMQARGEMEMEVGAARGAAAANAAAGGV